MTVTENNTDKLYWAMQSIRLRKGIKLLDVAGTLICTANMWYKLPVSLQSLIMNGLIIYRLFEIKS
jgi:hypothetical protein